MPDIAVVAVITAKAGSESTVKDALRTLEAQTRAEAGCQSYVLHESSAAPGTFVTVESWRSAADLDGHLASAHVAAALHSTQGHLSVPPAIHPLQPLAD